MVAIVRELTSATATQRLGRVGRRSDRVKRALPPLSPSKQLARAIATMAIYVSALLLVHLLLVSRLQHRASQEKLYDVLRAQLAEGTAPTGPINNRDEPLPSGTPIAMLEIPSIGVREVVVEGTSSSALLAGPGHRRDTPLPGQTGTSIIFGRRTTYGGPFGHLADLKAGDVVNVTTGQGAFEFTVIGLRREGDQVPDPPSATEGRLVLTTTDGSALLADGVLRVDAALQGTAVGGEPRLIAAAGLSSAERAMGVDVGTVWALALWIQALLLTAFVTSWSWHRWGRPHTWLALGPVNLFVGLAMAGEVARLLPNMV